MDIIEQLKNREETVWINPNLSHMEPNSKVNGYDYIYVKAALNRLLRFMPYIESAFPETAAKKGVIESDILDISAMKEVLNKDGAKITGKVILKDDAHLPIAGSVKARGGIHEVMHIAEALAQKANMLNPTDNYKKLDSDEFRQFFSQYTIQVGSTGNLGISIGRMAAKLGFKAIVHMSADAKQWKKDLLRSEGVIVKEYDSDYSAAVAQGRIESDADENSFFVDDENSKDLFFGYATAAIRTWVQFNRVGIKVGPKHPLFVYLPCGVGGAPGGITFGLKQLFGDYVHCFFAEPVDAPCFTLGMASGKKNEISVQDIGLSGLTIADGLAVGRPSGFVCDMMDTLVAGSYTVDDDRLLKYQKDLLISEELFLEPSACAGFKGLADIEREGSPFKKYIDENNLGLVMSEATHLIWATGGGLVPEQTV